MVVLVFITSCHVSEKLKIGPVMPHTTITTNASIKARGFPVARVIMLEKRLKNFERNDLFADFLFAII